MEKTFNIPFFTYSGNKATCNPVNLTNGMTCKVEFDAYIERESFEELMAIFNQMGFTISRTDWDLDKPLRIILSDSDVIALFKVIPAFRSYIDSMADTTIAQNGNQIIYLSEIYPEHEVILTNYCPSFIVEYKY